LRALWTEWSVEVRVLSGALEKPRRWGFSGFSGRATGMVQCRGSAPRIPGRRGLREDQMHHHGQYAMLTVRDMPEDQADPRPFEWLATLAPAVADALEKQGITFHEERDYDAPSPTRWARFATSTGAQFGVNYYYAHPRPHVDLRAPSIRQSEKHLRELLELLKLDESAIIDERRRPAT